jgi:hypothetical protein
MTSATSISVRSPQDARAACPTFASPHHRPQPRALVRAVPQAAVHARNRARRDSVRQRRHACSRQQRGVTKEQSVDHQGAIGGSPRSNRWIRSNTTIKGAIPLSDIPGTEFKSLAIDALQPPGSDAAQSVEKYYNKEACLDAIDAVKSSGSAPVRERWAVLADPVRPLEMSDGDKQTFVDGRRGW